MTVSDLVILVPTIFLVSISPGMCMTLAMVLGISVGLRRSLWMMAGELTGVLLVALIALLGASSVMLQYPNVFMVFKLLGGLYLIYLGINIFMAKGKMAITSDQSVKPDVSATSLITQGFITATANPKGWLFMLVLLPPFIDSEQALLPQMSLLLATIAVIELTCLMIYAGAGQMVSRLMTTPQYLRRLNIASGILMMGVGVWLAVG